MQLQQQLAAMAQLVRQERAAREQAVNRPPAAEGAARAAIEAQRHHHLGPASASSDQERIGMELMLQQERAARREAEHAAQQAARAAEVAARAAVEASRHHSVPAPVAVEENGRGRRDSGDFEMEDVSDPQQEIDSGEHVAPGGKSAIIAVFTLGYCTNRVWCLGTTAVAPPQESKKSQASKTRGPRKTPVAMDTTTGNKQKMSLAEVRKAAQEATERRMKERAKVLSSKK